MPRFAANLSMMYSEYAFEDRFAAAAADGFVAVEYLFPYAYDRQMLAQRLRDNGLEQVLFNLSPGDWDRGERGMACHPGREAEFMETVELALQYAEVLGCRRLHAMAGVVPPGVSPQVARAVYVGNLRRAAQRLAGQGVTLLIEPINTRDMPGYFLHHQQQAHDVVAEVAEPNLLVQMDFYHCQIMEGDLARRLERHLTGIGHIQIAGVPDRHEPDQGEVNYPWLFERLDALGYAGFVGCEYRPRAQTSAGLGWLRQLRERAPLVAGR